MYEKRKGGNRLLMYIYSKKWPSVKLLAEKLNCGYGRVLGERRKKGLIINWGRYRDFSGCAHVLNRTPDFNKFEVLFTLQKCGLNVPKVWKSDDDIEDCKYPIIGREFNHSKGTDIKLIRNKDELWENWENEESDYYMQLINKIAEYRVHVLGGKVPSIGKKKPKEGEEQDDIVWNDVRGYKHIEYRKSGYIYPKLAEVGIRAVEALKLDFGAVDVIVDEHHKIYVLEVNSAPGLIERRADLYAEYFKKVEVELNASGR